MRALAAPGPRSVLVLTGGRLAVVDPDTAFALAVDQGAGVLCTRADLADTADAYRAAGAVRDVVAAAVAALARDLTALLATDQPGAAR